MKTFGIVSYNIHCNFTNYGSAVLNARCAGGCVNGKYNCGIIEVRNKNV